MSRKQCPLGDEPWRVRDIQFDDPQVGVGASAPVDIGGAGRRIGRFIGADRFPYITAGQRESPFEQRAGHAAIAALDQDRSEEHTSELQSLMRISYAVFCLKK